MSITPAVDNARGRRDGSLVLFTWILLSANADGLPVEIPEWADRTWFVGSAGDVFGGATLSIEGSNDGVTFYTLANAAGGTPLTFTAGGCKTVIENPLFMRPNLTVVGAGASITVSVLIRRPAALRQ